MNWWLFDIPCSWIRFERYAYCVNVCVCLCVYGNVEKHSSVTVHSMCVCSVCERLRGFLTRCIEIIWIRQTVWTCDIIKHGNPHRIAHSASLIHSLILTHTRWWISLKRQYDWSFAWYMFFRWSFFFCPIKKQYLLIVHSFYRLNRSAF